MVKELGIVFFMFLCVSSFGRTKHFQYPLGDSYGYQIETGDEAVYFFSEQELIQKIEPGQLVKIHIKKSYKEPHLLSEGSFKDVLITDLFNVNNSEALQDFRNVNLARNIDQKYLLGLVLAVLIVALGMIKLFAPDTFYTYIMPFSTYSTTAESMGQLNLRNIILPVLFFLFCFSASGLWYSPPENARMVFFNIGLIAVVLLLKWLISRIISGLYDLGLFFKLHYLEFLKYGIILSILFFLTQNIMKFGNFNFVIIYNFSLFLYVLIWLVRLIIVFYRETNRNFIYFFSYLCATEGVPILILLVFWK